MDMSDLTKLWDELMVANLSTVTFTIIFWLILLFVMNKVLNRLINTKIKTNFSLVKRIKKVALMTIMIVVIAFQFKATKDIAAALLASSGIIAVVVGLASQEAASNLVAGGMILFTRPYNIGDYIVIKDHDIQGTVVDITFRQTIINTLNNTTLIIPNITMNGAIIENTSRIVTSKANFLYFSIGYDDDIDKAMDIIRDHAIHHPSFIDPRENGQDLTLQQAVPVMVTDLGDNGVQLRATVYSKDGGSGFAMCCDLRKSIKEAFDESGITIPYPTRTIIHCDPHQ